MIDLGLSLYGKFYNGSSARYAVLRRSPCYNTVDVPFLVRLEKRRGLVLVHCDFELVQT